MCIRDSGAGVIVSQLLKDNLMEAVDIQQLESFEAGCLFAQMEGIIPVSYTHLDQCLGVFTWEPQCYGNWKGYSKGMFDDSGKPTNSFNAFKR